MTVVPISCDKNDGFTDADMAVCSAKLVNLVGANNMRIVRMYLMYVDTFLVPYVVFGLDIAFKFCCLCHLSYSILHITSICE